jgi:hypothetical protein
MEFLRLFWKNFQKFGLMIGNFISTIVLGVFYFTVFGFFSLLYRLLTMKKSSADGWQGVKVKYTSINDFKDEF